MAKKWYARLYYIDYFFFLIFVVAVVDILVKLKKLKLSKLLNQKIHLWKGFTLTLFKNWYQFLDI